MVVGVKVGAAADRVIVEGLVVVVWDSIEESGVGVGVVKVVVVGVVVLVVLLLLFLLFLLILLLLLLSKIARHASACTRLWFGSLLVLFLGDGVLLSVGLA